TVATYTDISAGQDGRSGFVPSLVVDATNSKLLVATSNGANSAKPALFRCDLDGSGCTYTDISAGQGIDRGWTPSAVIDMTSAKLLVVTDNLYHRPSLFRCNLDGSGCSYTDISAGQGPGSGYTASAVIDSTNRKLLVATRNASNSGKPALFRCNLDGSGCTYTDISAGRGVDSGWSPSAAIDATNGKLLVVTENGANANKPALFRCHLDGTGCTYTDISVGQGANSGLAPSVVIDMVNGNLLVVTDNGANSDKPGLFTVCLQ
ncbi:MAG TPA: hypothetical protein VGJ84_14195, partial [Polyangiaceae bacterium]